MLLDNHGYPSESLLELLDILNIKHSNTLDSIVQVTQRKWLRPTDKERWHLDESYSIIKNVKLLSLFTRMGFFDEPKPQKQSYEYCLVLSSDVNEVRLRIAALIDYWNSGIRFNHIIFLAGHRELYPEFEGRDVLLQSAIEQFPMNPCWKFKGILPTHEAEMMRFVYNQAQIPEEMKKIPLSIVKAPGYKTSDGIVRRPRTSDTVYEWLNMNPKPGTCLAISNQPYIAYQDSILKTFLPEGFSLETVGYNDPNPVSDELYFDTLARYLYQERERLNEQ